MEHNSISSHPVAISGLPDITNRQIIEGEGLWVHADRVRELYKLIFSLTWLSPIAILVL